METLMEEVKTHAEFAITANDKCAEVWVEAGN
jgi:hypothetical protein